MSEELLTLLWVYCTIPHAPTGETPFSLTFGFEAVFLTELSLPSFSTGNFQATKNDEVLRQELDFVEEKRDQAYIRAAVKSKGPPSISTERSNIAVSR